MPVCKIAIENLAKFFDPDEVQDVVRLAKKIDALEAMWRARLDRAMERIIEQVTLELIETGKITKDLPFDQFFSEQAFDVSREALNSTKTMPKIPRAARLAGPPKGKVPRSLKDLMREWDYWRKKGTVPPRQKAIAKKISKAYINKVQDFWERHSGEFREGDQTQVYDQNKAKKAIKRWSESTHARAKMIVETETTYYYNQVRRKAYDASSDVTHYLFMAIRDRRTTKWCRTRHQLVYKKGDPLLEKETPPIHWNCRSEVLPLTYINPRHRALIDDATRARRNNSPEPLPKGWGKR